MMLPLKSSLLTVLAISCVGCQTSKQTSLHKEEFGNADMFTYAVPGSSSEACEAARRALLSQGYIINEVNQNGVRGKRKFQANPEAHVEIEFTIVCASNSKGSNTSTIFANAVRDQYALKKSSTSASLGVGGIGSISLPFGESNDSLVKVASETISDPKLYSRFYDLLERYMDDVRVGDVEKENPKIEATKGVDENSKRVNEGAETQTETQAKTQVENRP